MRTPPPALLAIFLLAAGCASRPLPKYETPIARTQFQRVRTTAYTHTESDHVQYSNHNALGGVLQSGQVQSAAADWSRWPAGTIFRVVETGELYQVDDYGWALAGTNTIDLYKPTRAAMNAWGVRRVTIENLQWGDPRRSLAVLRPRASYRHIARMVREIDDRYAELTRPVPTSAAPELIAGKPSPVAPQSGASGSAQPFRSVAPAAAAGVPVASAVPVAQPVSSSRTAGSPARDPFFANSVR